MGYGSKDAPGGLLVNGEFWMWGEGVSGTLAQDSNVVNRSSPVSVIGAHQFVQTTGGINLHIGRKKDGTAWAWGLGTSGELGQGTSAVNRSSPVSVVGAHSFIKIRSGEQHTIGLKADGTVWSWGLGSSGKLGQGSTIVNRSSPVSLVGGHLFIDIDNAGEGGIGIKSNGETWTWGRGDTGELGQGTSAVNRSSPVSVVGAHSFIKLSGGVGYIGLKSDGTVWCWGLGTQGNCGEGSTAVNRSSPVSVVGGHSFINIHGGLVMMGLKSDGTLWTWGENTTGQLGDNTTNNRSSPVSVIGNHSFIQIGGGNQYSFALKVNGQVWTWGRGLNGVLGEGSTVVNRSSPVLVVGGFNFKSLDNQSDIPYTPSAPQSLLATTISSTEIDLSWNAPSDNGGGTITGYKIERKIGAGSFTTLVADTGNSNTTYADTGLTSGATYTYQIYAINAAGTGSVSNTSAATTDNDVPLAPTSLDATTISSTEIDLSWTAPTDVGESAISGYKIERKVGAGAYSTLVADTGNTNTTYADTGLSVSTLYTYRVSAINSFGAGQPSNEDNATTLDGRTSVPLNLVATAVSKTQIDLDWDAPADDQGFSVTGYKIERESPVDGGFTTLVSNTGNTNTSYSDTGLTRFTEYNYRVSAINVNGISNSSNESNDTTNPDVADAITDLLINSNFINALTLFWTAPYFGGGTITGYKIERKKGVDGTWGTLVANTGNTNVIYTDSTVEVDFDNPIIYFYRVSTINTIGTSLASNEESGKITLAIIRIAELNYPSNGVDLKDRTQLAALISWQESEADDEGIQIDYKTGKHVKLKHVGGRVYLDLFTGKTFLKIRGDS